MTHLTVPRMNIVGRHLGVIPHIQKHRAVRRVEIHVAEDVAAAIVYMAAANITLPLQLQHPAVAVQHVHQVKFVATGRLA